ncbi:MAG: UDP-3-O-(3-hydroxymyristoyl)glucosamine N-acyltransferase [Gemmatimonadota bacterium]
MSPTSPSSPDRTLRASEIAELVGGQFEGAHDPEITGVAPLDRASGNELSFVAHPKYAPYLGQSRAGAILATEKLIPRGSTTLPRIVVGDVQRALAAVLKHFHPEPSIAEGIHESAVIGSNVRLDGGVRVGAHCVIGDNCAIGANSFLYPQVTLYSNVRMGERCIVHSGARIGSDGFGYTMVDGQHRKVPQVGGVVIGNDVEIGANTCIDRGSVGPTEIGNGVKIDNLVHIGHNVRIGDLSIIVAQAGVSGSTMIGKGVTLAGQAGLVGHIRIGDGAIIGAQAGVIGDVPAGAVYSGYPARPHKEAMRAQGALFKLPEILRRMRKLERE